MTIEIIAVWSIAATSLVVLIVLFFARPAKSTVSRGHIKGSASPARPPVPDAEMDTTSNRPPAGSRRTRARQPITLQQRMVRAGIYGRGGAATFQTVRIALSAGLFLTVLAIGWSHIQLPEANFLIAGLAGIAGYLTPSFWLDHRLAARQTNIRRALPDALDLITVCMQGGLSIPAALARVSRELGTAHPLLATELGIVEREVQMGRTTGEAIRNFADRFDLEELRSLASVVWQTERFGGSIVGALTTYAAGMRTKRKQRAEEMAQKAAVKLLFPTILCIFPGIFVVVLGPTAIRVYEILIVGNPWSS